MFRYKLNVSFVVLARNKKNNLTMTDKVSCFVLGAHNTLYSRIAKENAKNKIRTRLPNAVNMNFLIYSLTVESLAQEETNACYFDSSYVNGTFNNLWISVHTTTDHISPSLFLSF